ncbi:leucyl aminopeptidase family protein [Paenirhodobacter sp.]|uniref:leucyl aminopeptidase family protein n=1 Tax=Paenirhodobacter sp. TaxID=1965326 RepID=UPI003B3FD8C4
MTDILPPRPALRFAPGPGLPLYPLAAGEELPEALSPAQRAFAAGFTGALGAVCLLPGADGVAGALIGLGDEAARRRGRFHLAAGRALLPAGDWALSRPCSETEALGWLLEGYRYDRYAPQKAPGARLVCPEGLDARRIEIMAEAEALTRDLINTPPNDMGPEEIESAARALAERHGATVAVVTGDDLLTQGYPLIHAVGRASPRAPRLIDLRWGDVGPEVALVGKGVCFDTGGLDIKPPSSMGLMKKDMGGAATVLGLAHMVMALGLRLRLRVLIPAVENAVGGNAFRPQDIYTSRKGLTVEINNTDAEGRLVLADALAAADEEAPDLILCLATLTGAARVALGPDVMPFYTDSDDLAGGLARGAEALADPLWRMPFWEPYEPLIEPGIADLDNAPSGGMAGSITAALFLRRFVTEAERFAHFDIYGWQPTARPGRPKGAVGQGARAILSVLEEIAE